MADETIQALREMQRKWEAEQEKKNKPCPSCGHCPNCGRRDAAPVPYWPLEPYRPYFDHLWRPYPGIVWTSDTDTASAFKLNS